MLADDWKKKIWAYDSRRDMIVPGEASETIEFCTEHFITLANAAILLRGKFFVALSGGSTPNSIFKMLASSPYRNEVDWEHVVLFWSDERKAPPDDPESNYGKAMASGLDTLPLKDQNIHRMVAEKDIEKNAKRYEKTILELVPDAIFDLIMLGMGEDGHTASLFPKTHALHVKDRLVTANFVPQKDTWRMTMTYKCINQARETAIYVLGENKAQCVKEVFTSTHDSDIFPIQDVGTPDHKVLWILDKSAARLLLQA